MTRLSEIYSLIADPLPCDPGNLPQPLGPEDCPTFAGLTIQNTAGKNAIIELRSVLNKAAIMSVLSASGHIGQYNLESDLPAILVKKANVIDPLHAVWADNYEVDGERHCDALNAGLTLEHKYLRMIRGVATHEVDTIICDPKVEFELTSTLKLTAQAANEGAMLSVGVGGVVESTPMPINRLLNGYSTGVLEGLMLSATLGTTKFTVAPGKYQTVDNYTDVDNPDYEEQDFPGAIDVEVENIGTQPITFVFLDKNKVIQQRASIDQSFIFELLRDEVLIGFVNHINLAQINSVANGPFIPGAIDPNLLAMDLSLAISAINLQGNNIIANGANLTIDKTAGLAFFAGINTKSNPKNPNTIPLPKRVAPPFVGSWRNGAGGFTLGLFTDVTPGVFDDDAGGVGLPNGSVMNNEYTNQRWVVGPDNFVGVQFGQKKYATLDGAVNGRLSEPFEDNPLFAEILFRTVMSVKGNAVNLSSALEAIFTSNPKFGLGGGGSGGAVSAQSLQDAYTNSPTPVEIGLTAALGQISIVDAGISVNDLWRITNNAKTIDYLKVTNTAVSVTGDLVINTDALVLTASNDFVGIGNATPSCILQVRTDIANLGAFNLQSVSGAMLESLNDNGGSTPSTPEPALLLVRDGVSVQSWSNLARFDLSRYENVAQNSRTRLDMKLAHGDLAVEGNNTPLVMSLFSSGDVEIPNGGLTVLTDAMHVDAATKFVGLGVTAPTCLLHNRTSTVGLVDFNIQAVAGAMLGSLNNNGGNVLAASEPALILTRDGVANEAFPNVARFDLSRYENSGDDSRTQLTIKLAHGLLFDPPEEGNDTPTVMTMRSNGDVDIPNGNLAVRSDTDAVTILGKARINNGGVVDSAAFSHFDRGTVNDFALRQHSTGQTFLNTVAGSNLLIQVGGTTALTVQTDSNVVVNTADLKVPNGTLRVSVDSDVDVFLGRAKITNAGVADVAAFSHFDRGGATDYAIKQAADGETCVNSAAGESLKFQIGGVNTLLVLSSSDIIVATGDLDVSVGTLRVSPNTDKEILLGRAKITAAGSTDFMALSHFDFGGATDFAFGQTNLGATIVNSAPGTDVVIKTGGVNTLTASSTGDVSISFGTLVIQPHVDLSVTLGTCKVFALPASDTAMFSHFNYANSTGFALSQDNMGDTTVNSRAAGRVVMRVDPFDMVAVTALGLESVTGSIILNSSGTGSQIINKVKIGGAVINGAQLQSGITEAVLDFKSDGVGAGVNSPVPNRTIPIKYNGQLLFLVASTNEV